MGFYNSKEITEKIISGYKKLETTLEKEGLYIPFFKLENGNIFFDTEVTACYYSDEEGYHYEVSERGVLRESIISQNVIEIIYLCFKNYIFRCAREYQRKKCTEKKGYKEIMKKELEYWSVLGKEVYDYAKMKMTQI